MPTLVIHGDDDRIVPITAAGQRSAKLVKGAHWNDFFFEQRFFLLTPDLACF
jgi:pimeloyl-ACP methyl ester carboxylesterase